MSKIREIALDVYPTLLLLTLVGIGGTALYFDARLTLAKINALEAATSPSSIEKLIEKIERLDR